MEQVYWRVENGDYIDIDDMSRPQLQKALKKILLASDKDQTLKELAQDGELSEVLEL